MVLATLLSGLGVSAAMAQDPPAPQAGQPSTADQAAQPSTDDNVWRAVRFGATFEGYYQYNWNQPPDRVIPLRAYDKRGNEFSIQQVALVLDLPPAVTEKRRYGLRVDLQYVQAAASDPNPDVSRHIWQAYGSYVFPVGPKGLTADFGKFASMLGYETNYAKDNQAFSRGYLFTFLPFYHAGLRVSVPASDQVTLLYMLTNGIQQTEDFNDFKSNHFAAIAKPHPAVTWTINYYFGQEQPDGGQPGGPDGFFRVFDMYVAVTPTPSLSLGLDVIRVTNEVQKRDVALSLEGVGAYARYQITPKSGVGLRYERLNDQGLFAGIEQVLQEATVTAEYKLADAFMLRGEFRRDWSSAPMFPGPGGSADPRSHQSTALVGAIWTIGNKQGAW